MHKHVATNLSTRLRAGMQMQAYKQLAITHVPGKEFY